MEALRVTVRQKGPLFEPGVPAHVLNDWQRDTLEEIAHQAQQEIQRRARGFNKSGRGGTGRAASAVHAYDRGSSWAVVGENNEGVVWWPWLEGTSKRNATTRFKGYHVFRIVKNIMRRKAKRIGDDIMQAYLPFIGGR